ncbi:MAG: hypothetical protein H6828_01600 [Planctomycetes bacterium]|nr:hypothetical protein [Planctomycetota bacterium]
MLRSLALLALLSPAAAAQTPDAPAPSPAPAAEDAAPRAPARRQAIDGLAGFVARSTVVFAGRPDAPPHRLEIAYDFPERVRWRIEPVQDEPAPGARHLRFQFGAAVWLWLPGESASTALDGAEARRVRLQNELRRVALTWPAGLAWSPAEGETRSATLPELGRLVAEFAPGAAHPRRLSAIFADDREGLEVYDELEWGEREGRAWPTRWTFVVDGEPVWRETLDEVQLGVRHRDSYFRPTDRRAAQASDLQLQAVDLPARVYVRRTLEPGCAWPEAMRRAEATVARWSAELGPDLAVDPRPTYLLDELARPVGFEVRLAPGVERVPAGWTRGARREGWTTLLTELADLGPAPLERLRAEVGTVGAAATPYARLQREGDRVGWVQLVLPLRQER